MKIALIGYGKMGQAVEAEAKARGHEISFIADGDTQSNMDLIRPENTDVCIEFTQPESALKNFYFLLAKGNKVVSGTTGWHQHMDEVKGIVQKTSGTFMFSPNFSPGMNILFALNKKLASLMNQQPDYDVYVSEAHHRHKKDAPGGSALALTRGILDNLDRKSAWVFADLKHRPPVDNEISISVTRAGNVTGIHEVTYTSAVDQVSIRHEAYNRRGFALGAVMAAEYIQDKKGFFQFSEIFEI